MSSSKNNKTQIPWAAVILLLIFFCPIGLYLLYLKLTGDKKNVLHNSKILSTIGWVFIGCAMIYLLQALTGNLSIKDGASPVPAMIILMAFFGGGGILFLYNAKKIRINAERYKKYNSIVKFQNKTLIDEIASAISIDYDHVVKDLQKMIDIGYFENAYINDVSREIVFEQTQNIQAQMHYQNTQSVPTKSNNIVVTCKNCGANNTITVGEVSECEFCGSPLT